MEVTTITAAAIQLTCILMASALMQVVPLTIIPAHPAVLPLKINLLLETRLPKETAAPQVSTGWQKDDHGWWYRLSADSYYADGVADIDGSTYLFNSDGYMLTGWQQLNGHWYYFNPSGAMVTGGQIIEGKILLF